MMLFCLVCDLSNLCFETAELSESVTVTRYGYKRYGFSNLDTMFVSSD